MSAAMILSKLHLIYTRFEAFGVIVAGFLESV